MSGRNMFPFTATQWEELEHQALIFKYVVSGIPIPPDLLFSIKRSCLNTRLFSRQPPPPHPHVGWNCFQVGLGRKVDPEPGRCRRTNGKKWRCSKEAYPDSKFCERHMHRGKKRSRKPAEVSTGTSSSTRANPSLSFMDYRRNSYVYGVKEEVDSHAHAVFSGASMDNSWQLTPLTTSSSSSKQNEYSYLKLQNNKDVGEAQKTVHRFIDEWPLKHGDP
ncbi:growth-regulating factor 5-like isoform X2 [Hibiscus syriacus]|uniref:Growth-regulating factor n=1 Tax=Hibiscus syriacus TaxID=106335 RepID=A0A6A3D0I8_HIBSY|nr:growth-regulating factor 5-like [Hibiscus syriacus]KAE8735315.1 growth-regulating factor 5-like isoform X2 [Hibiscus syriacus]